MFLRIALLLSTALLTASAACTQTSPAANTTSPSSTGCRPESAAPDEGHRDLLAGDFSAADTFFVAQPPSPESTAGRVAALIGSHKSVQALELARDSAEKHPTSATAQVALGDALLRRTEVNAAVQAFGKALQLDQCNPRAHFGAGRYYTLIALPDRAARELGIAHRLAPADPELALAWAETVPAAERVTVIQAALAAMPPAVDARLRAERAGILAQAQLVASGKLCSPAEPFQTASLPLSPLFVEGNNVRDWGLQTAINGSKPVLLELDSSVDGLVLSRKDAERFGVQFLPGADDRAFGFVSSVRIGKVTWKDCPVHVVEDSTLAGERSLISTSFFAQSLIHIDWVTQAITLSAFASPDAPPSAEEKTWAHVLIDRNRILLPTVADKKSYVFLLDTGNPYTILAQEPASGFRIRNSALENLKGHSGDFVKLYRDNNPATVGPHVSGPDGKQVVVYDTLAMPIVRFGGTETLIHLSYSLPITGVWDTLDMDVAGLLGFEAIYNNFIDLDYRHGLVRFVFDQMNRYATRQNAQGGRAVN